MSTAPSTAAPAPPTERFAHLPLALVLASLTNPRKHFDPSRMADLTRSIAEKGVVQPIVVRPTPIEDLYEIVAGETRWRCAKRAGLTEIPAIIRAYTDEQALEIQLIENLHRNDLTPMEQAMGFRALISTNPDKHSVESIAMRIGMSDTWVWDRLKLADLIDEAKALLEDGRIGEGHAIRIARLKADDQARVVAHGSGRPQLRGGLWTEDHGGSLGFDDTADEAEADPYAGLKPVSVRELESWIRDHVRFDVAHMAQAAPLEYEPAAHRVEAAQAQPGRGAKVIEVTYSHFVQPDAKSDEGRTYGPSTWRRADGHDDASPTCDHAIVGVVVAGARGYGETFAVCIAREQCEVHWGKEIKDKRKAAQLRAKGDTAGAAAVSSKAEQRRRQEDDERAAKQRRWEKLRPALIAAAQEAAARQPQTLPPAVFRAMVVHEQLPETTTVAGLAKALLLSAVASLFRDYAWHGDEPQWVEWAQLLGVDVAAVEAAALGEPAPAMPGARPPRPYTKRAASAKKIPAKKAAAKTLARASAKSKTPARPAKTKTVAKKVAATKTGRRSA